MGEGGVGGAEVVEGRVTLSLAVVRAALSLAGNRANGNSAFFLFYGES